VTQLINEFQNKGVEGADFFSYDFEINDYPLNARQKACNQNFLKEVQHQTNCSVSLRGVYVEPGKKVPIGCRKLYLHIQGENKYYVTTAYKEIKGVLEENAYESLHSGMAPGKYSI
jgi:ATP-dependent RNA helicase DDX46/PRP5